MKAKTNKVIFDTNVWISFLIGKRLSFLKPFISEGQITIVYSEQLIVELKDVTSRPKLRKYFPQNEVKEMLELIEVIGLKFETVSTHKICKDLKELNSFKNAQILTPAEFEVEMISKN